MQNLDQLKQDLIETGRWIDSRHWCPATSGNLSAWIDAEQFLITVSGKGKGELTPADLMIVDAGGNPVNTQLRPSAETLLHSLIYSRFPDARYVFHTHSVYGTIMSRAIWSGQLVFRNYELQKAFSGIDTHDVEMKVPVFGNSQDMVALAKEVEQHFDSADACHAFILAGHGVYTWGKTAREARRHVEAMEFLLECEYKSCLLLK
jgi:methylthioribulose-1-phosphate dehydratase